MERHVNLVLSNEYLIANIDVDTAENEPLKICRTFGIWRGKKSRANSLEWNLECEASVHLALDVALEGPHDVRRVGLARAGRSEEKERSRPHGDAEVASVTTAPRANMATACHEGTYFIFFSKNMNNMNILHILKRIDEKT